jgi:nicotinic acid mononucleotide adenylyltransferase
LPDGNFFRDLALKEDCHLSHCVRQANDPALFDRRVGTADLLDMLCREEPDTDFSFCLGADTFLDLMAGKWKRSHDVIRMLQGRLWIIPRPTETQDGNDGEIDESSAQRQLQARIDELNRHGGIANNAARLLTVPHLLPISSTSVRNCIDRTKLETLVVPSVLTYIEENHLYAFRETKKIV